MKNNSPFYITDTGSKGHITASKEFFERDAVLAVSSKYSEEFYVSVMPHDEFHVSIILERKDRENILENTLRQFMNELIDQQIRVDLQKEFGKIRETIVKHAFFPVGK